MLKGVILIDFWVILVSFLGHLGCQIEAKIGLEAPGGPHGAPKGPLESPRVPFWSILGSFWDHFRVIWGAKLGFKSVLRHLVAPWLPQGPPETPRAQGYNFG